MQKIFLNVAKSALILAYLVIIAGAVVRMTGSGMGCPDWPKCFGYYIPPTEISQLEWQEDRAFKKGQVIIREESLWVAKSDFTTTNQYNPKQWEAYTQHDYAAFNVWHTWIEYINRLATVLLGIPVILLMFLSFWLYRKDPWITYLSFLTLLALGFQAWLGKTVVDSNLLPLKITTHLIMAFVFVALLLYLIFRVQLKHLESSPARKKMGSLFVISILLTIIQIIMGTQVRQFIDTQVIQLGEDAAKFWLQDPTINFYLHRSFSIVIVLFNGFLFYRISKLALKFPKISWVMVFIGLELATGIAMNYFDFPFASQPLHLLWASLLFGVQFYLVLEAFKSGSSLKTL